MIDLHLLLVAIFSDSFFNHHNSGIVDQDMDLIRDFQDFLRKFPHACKRRQVQGQS